MLVDHVGIDTGVGYNIGHVFMMPWQTSTLGEFTVIILENNVRENIG
jgi:hypothetical protein